MSPDDDIIETISSEKYGKYVSCLRYKPEFDRLLKNNQKNIIISPPCFILTHGKKVKLYPPVAWVTALRVIAVFVNTGILTPM